ncbi:hypothetical protein NM208_g1124 [Fusarium decemcellulare]|uniref:Uncharacterized protein n=1 Tax=Fusarium decemcellulare TaxID=57161 RepID=A0ACC1SXB5_9HYPO|nr:hypothetical protein NM208_g1124 [Fusarium decemcellulare]
MIESDAVYPLYFLDDISTGRFIALSEILLFNEVLVGNKLHEGLVKLIHQGDWRKLGGRLRMRWLSLSKVDGGLEVHVPKEFTQDRPAIRFTTEVFDISIHEHELASQLPKATGGPLRTSYTARLLTFDLAILGLHVTSFTDSTTVACAWPHAIAGALGLKGVLSAWPKALRDINDLPPLLGARKDVMNGVGTVIDEKAPYGLASVQIKVESRALFLPRQFLTQLRLSCIKELEMVHGTDSTPFVSDGDVLTAWASRFVARSRGGKWPALTFNPLDITSRLSAPWERGEVYVQNMAGAMCTSLDVDVRLRRSLGELAQQVRVSIQQQATDEQIRAQLRNFRTLGHTKAEPLYGNPDAQLVSTFLYHDTWQKLEDYIRETYSYIQ